MSGRPALADTLDRLYGLALTLYPAPMRGEYAAEMQAVFRLRVQAAAGQGGRRLLALAAREARDLPPAILAAHLSAGGGRMRDLFPVTSDQTPWAAALLSLLPFVLAGPLRIVLSYQPDWAPGSESHLYFWYLLVCTLVLAGGLLLGAARKFPRWVYPYPLYLSFSLNTVILYAVYLLRGQASSQAYTLLALGTLLLVFCLPGLNVFYRRIRQDWTRLSYGVFGLVLYLLAGVDFDEAPTLTLLVLLPSLLALLTALAHLRIRPAPGRIAALLAGTFAALLVWLLPIFSGMITPLIGVLIGSGMLLLWASFLGGLMLAPLLITWVVHTWRAGRAA